MGLLLFLVVCLAVASAAFLSTGMGVGFLKSMKTDLGAFSFATSTAAVIALVAASAHSKAKSYVSRWHAQANFGSVFHYRSCSASRLRY